jgi:biopolymer transport protein ExbB/TolQ
MLSNGIAEAMYNTALGLGIAVFCMITHIILHTRAKNIQHDLESTMEKTFNLLTLQQR